MTEDYTLAHGTHASPQEGRCAMEWVSHLAGEPHSDEPTCVSPVLRALCIALNDGLCDGPRQRLRPYLTRTIGTVGDGLDDARSWLAIDWLVRSYAPAWLELAGLGGEATALTRRPPVVDPAGLADALDELERARGALRAARRAAVRAGAGSRPSRWAQRRTRRRGREAAWACAGAAAWAAARVRLGDGAGERLRALSRMIAGDAAAVALARVADDEVCGALEGRDARASALGPTLETLAGDAFGLLERMLPGESIELREPAGALTTLAA